jgi:ribosomal protein L11 methyltransferase
MTFVARIELAEQTARQLSDAIGDDPELGWPTVAVSESGPGRWSVEVYFAERPGSAAKATLRRLAGTAGTFAFSELPNRDWVSESLKGLKPVRAGRFLVHGRHDRGALHANDVGIEIEAGEAFGTGHHGTTAGCLLEIDRLARIRSLRRLLDVGTGSGVLAIAMAKRWHGTVLATDIDPVAVRIARANARLNGATTVRTILTGSLGLAAIRRAGPFDLIVGNILAGPLQHLTPAIARLLAPGGVAVYSGILLAQRPRIMAACRASGLVLVHGLERDGWVTLTFARPRRLAIKKIRAERVRVRRWRATSGHSRMSPSAHRRSQAASR